MDFSHLQANNSRLIMVDSVVTMALIPDSANVAEIFAVEFIGWELSAKAGCL